MCGIIGYIGNKKAKPILLKGLKRLEYRGYDSAGIVTLSKGKISISKCKGRISDLENLIKRKPLSGSVGLGHCLSPETLVYLSDGRLKKISELTGNKKVVSLNFNDLKCKNGYKVKAFKHKSPSFLYEVKTPYFSFRATGNHRIIVCSPNGQIGEKEIRNIKDELLAIPRRISCINGKPFRLKESFVKRHYILTKKGRKFLYQLRTDKKYTWNQIKETTGINKNYIRRLETGERLSIEEQRLKKLSKIYSFNISGKYFIPSNWVTNNITLPKNTSSELMQIIGYHTGDGYIDKRFLRYKEEREEICQIYQSLFKKVFNINSELVKGKTYCIFTINSKFIVDWLKENFKGAVAKTSQKNIDEFVGSLPKKQLAAFLRGLFDAEGNVGIKGRQIALRMISKKVIKKTQLLLLRFGILATYCKMKRKKWSDVHCLLINDRKSMENFYREIGFSSKDKQNLLKNLIDRMQRLTFKHRSFPIRKDFFYKEFLKPNNIRDRSCHSGTEKSYITNYALEKLSKRTANLNLKNQISHYLNSDIVWVKPKIRKVRSDVDYVYDLEVKSKHNFIGNGIVQHNSRWATHGAPSKKNAHPHKDCSGKIAVVHNGIIENHEELKKKLAKEGCKFKSETDTEVISHLVNKLYSGNLRTTLINTIKKLKGSYALGILSFKEPDKIVVARCNSPLIIGLGKKENFIASDAPAILEHTKKVVYLEDNQVAEIKKDSIEIFNLKNEKVSYSINTLSYNIDAAKKGNYKHFMLKEINEQPRISSTLLKEYITGDEISFKKLNLGDNFLKNIKNIIIIACGTAYHAGIVGKYILESLVRIPVEVSLSSEFRYRSPVLEDNCLVIPISQSGETADTLAAVREAKKTGAKILPICNVLGSSLTRETNSVIYTHAGPEIGVASTKAYTAQLTVLYLFSLYLSQLKGLINSKKLKKKIKELKTIPEKQTQILENNNKIKKIAKKHLNFGAFLYLGRNINFPSALEGALKLKEISYIPAEGYAAGEMKHGPIALIDEYRAVVCIVNDSPIYEKMVSNVREILARKGKLIGIATNGNKDIKQHIKEVIYIPKISNIFSPLLITIPLQLFAYHVADLKGYDVDKPRNLAKSVTVE